MVVVSAIAKVVQAILKAAATARENSKTGHSGSNISIIMHLELANMLMWQAIKEEKDGYNNIGSNID